MRTLLSVLGSLIAVAGTVPYIIETIRGNTKPRIVTWLTWALLTGVAGAASMSAGQLGAAVFALLGTVATSSVVVAGLRYGDRSFTRLDLACLAGVLLGLVLWLSLDNPIFAIWTADTDRFRGTAPDSRSCVEATNGGDRECLCVRWRGRPHHIGGDRQWRVLLGRRARLSAICRRVHGNRCFHHRDPPEVGAARCGRHGRQATG